MPRRKRMALLALMVIAALLVQPVAAQASSIIYFERPGIAPGGAMVESIAEKAGKVKALSKLTPKDLDRLEAANLASASKELLSLLGLAPSAAGAETRGILASALPGASAVFKEGLNDVVSALTGQTDEGPSELNIREAEDFIEDALRAMMTVDTTYFVDEEARRQFWAKMGVYEKYTNAQIEYINKMVIPTVAGYLVSNNEMGLLTLWQALNGLGAEVSSGTAIHPQQTTVHIAPSEAFFGSGEQGNAKKVMELFNGSLGALGLLYHAARQFGSGAGTYAGLDGYLAGLDFVTNIPLAKSEGRTWVGVPEYDGGPMLGGGNSNGTYSTGLDGSAFEFTISHRITK